MSNTQYPAWVEKRQIPLFAKTLEEAKVQAQQIKVGQIYESAPLTIDRGQSHVLVVMVDMLEDRGTFRMGRVLEHVEVL